MAILKKPEPKKCKCGLPAGTSASSLSMLMGAGRTSSPEESAMRREMDKIRLDTMKADLRKHVAEADLAEVMVLQARHMLEARKAGRSNGVKRRL